MIRLELSRAERVEIVNAAIDLRDYIIDTAPRNDAAFQRAIQLTNRIQQIVDKKGKR